MPPARMNSPKMLVIRFAQVGKVYVPFVFLQRSFSDNFSGWYAFAWSLLFWVVTLERLHELFYDWWTIRFCITKDGFRFETGLVAKKEVQVAWRDVASLQISQSLIHRWLRCSTATIGIGSQAMQSLVLEAIDNDLSEEIAFHHGRVTRTQGTSKLAESPPSEASKSSGYAGAPDSPPPRADSTDARIVVDRIYDISAGDYLLIAFTYGHFVLLAPFLLNAYSEIGRWGILDGVGLLETLRETPGGLKLAFGMTVISISAIIYGYVVAWLRYKDYSVCVIGGDLLVSGGIISAESRRVHESQIQGIRIDQNPIMRLTGRGRMSLVSRDPGGRTRSNIILPAANARRISETIKNYFPAYSSSQELPRLSAGSSAVILSVVSATAIGTLWLARTMVDPRLGPLVFAFIGLFWLIVLNYFWAIIDVDEKRGNIKYRRGFLWIRSYDVSVTSVHVVAWRQGPLGRLLGTASLTIYIYAGKPLRLRMVGAPESSVERLTQEFLALGSPARTVPG